MSTEVPGTPEERVTPEPVAPAAPKASSGPTKDETNMGMLAHLLGLAWIVGPLIIWLMKKDESKYVEEQAREALNFQITVGIASIAISFIPVIGPFLAPMIGLADFVLIIIATMEANKGVQYKYPVNLRLIK